MIVNLGAHHLVLKFSNMYFKVATPAHERKFHAELNTDEASIKKNVQALIQWLEKQPHLPNVKGIQILL